MGKHPQNKSTTTDTAQTLTKPQSNTYHHVDKPSEEAMDIHLVVNPIDINKDKGCSPQTTFFGPNVCIACDSNKYFYSFHIFGEEVYSSLGCKTEV